MKVVIIYSGGMDSFTLLNDLIINSKIDKKDIYVLSFFYGQKHRKELGKACLVCKELDINIKVVDITYVGDLLDSSLTKESIEVPEGYYTDELMKHTVVPNRNMIMLSIAAGYAMTIEARTVFYAAHAGDHAIYPDCREGFVKAMSATLQVSHYTPITIAAPYLTKTKADILKIGLMLGLDYSNTWTCYKGKAHACGKCGSCVERLEAFKLNNAIDPILYERGIEK